MPLKNKKERNETNKQSPHTDHQIPLKARLWSEGSLPVQCCPSQALQNKLKNETIKNRRTEELKDWMRAEVRNIPLLDIHIKQL